MNIVSITGRLTNDPELRRTQSGTACCSFTLAVRRPKVKDTTDFHNFVVWQQGAEYLSQYGHKGDLVAVTGYLTTREWTDKDGNKRKTTEVTCDAVELLSSKKNTEGNNQPAQRQNSSQGQHSYSQQSFQPIDIPDAQLPF
jgi:single-strand DNA-binding protein